MADKFNVVKVQRTQIVDINKGKLPPQAVSLEEAVIGAMLVDNGAINEAMEVLFSDVFYKDSHKYIFDAIYSLYNRNEPVDLLTVSQELRKMSKLELCGGDYYLIQLTQKIASSAHIDYHSRILIQKYVQRKCISTSSELIEKSYSDDADVFDLLEQVYKEYGQVSDLITVGKIQDFKESVDSFLNTTQVKNKGVPSSLSNLDKKLNGYQDSDLIIIAARPGMGKTAFVLNEVLECGLNGIPVAFFSLEMSTKQIIGRLLSIISGIEITKINNFYLTNSERLYLKTCADLLSSLPIIIDDIGGISPMELKIKCNKLKREKGIKMIVVDYLQLMKVKNKKISSRENEISEISQSLKNLAKSLNVPVLALSQLSRSVEQRGANKRPLLSDLRDSGSIEQDADIVIFIYRPEYYKIEQWDDESRSSTENQVELEIAKYRNGSTAYCRVGCDLKYMRFMILEHAEKDLTFKYFRGKDNVDYGTLNIFEENKDEPDGETVDMPF